VKIQAMVYTVHMNAMVARGVEYAIDAVVLPVVCRLLQVAPAAPLPGRKSTEGQLVRKGIVRMSQMNLS